MKKILVPTDFSEFSAYAFDFALRLAKGVGAQIHLYHSILSPVDWNKLPDEVKNNFPELTQRIHAAQSALYESVKAGMSLGVEVLTVLEFNSDAKAIVRYASEIDAYAVVMGSHGEDTLERAFLGTYTQSLLRLSERPVFVIKNDQFSKIGSILFASDFSEKVYYEFSKVIDIAKVFDSSIELLYINTPTNFEETSDSELRMKMFADNYPYHSFETKVYNAFSEERGIIDYAESKDVGIIAMITHGRSGFDRILFGGSIAENVASQSSSIVLSMKLKD